MSKSKNDILSEKNHDFESLVSIMDILRGDGGCPWDKEQTHSSIRKCLIEETYEVVEAIDNNDYTLLCEELGDLLFQTVFHAKIESEAGNFNINDVVNGVCNKMINRHPHVFAGMIAENSNDVSLNWDQIKLREKQQSSITESMRKIAPGLPSLIKAQKVHSKARKELNFGFASVEEALNYAKTNVDVSVEDAIFALAAAAEIEGIDIEKTLNDKINGFVNECELYKFSDSAVIS